MPLARTLAVTAALGSVVVALTACASDPQLILGAGPSGGSTAICVGEFSEPMTFGEPLRLTPGAPDVTLVRAELVDAEGVRVVEQAAARAVLLADGTHLGVGSLYVDDGDEAWDGRVPLDGTVVSDDGGETWFVALALERTGDIAGGFAAVDLTYEVNGERHVARGTQSMSFPATGKGCP